VGTSAPVKIRVATQARIEASGDNSEARAKATRGIDRRAAAAEAGAPNKWTKRAKSKVSSPGLQRAPKLVRIDQEVAAAI
jgi:hypothetical protein